MRVVDSTTLKYEETVPKMPASLERHLKKESKNAVMVA